MAGGGRSRRGGHFASSLIWFAVSIRGSASHGSLRSTNQDSQTLVIFTSDNGGERYSFQWPLSDGKGSLWEGGIRVPAIVHWPGTVAALAAPRIKSP